MVPGTFSGTIPSVLASRNFSNLYSIYITWGGWGTNPRPADYENSGPVHRTHELHGYHGVVPPMALIALFAPMARSTNRSTTYSGRWPIPTTQRYYWPRSRPRLSHAPLACTATYRWHSPRRCCPSRS